MKLNIINYFLFICLIKNNILKYKNILRNYLLLSYLLYNKKEWIIIILNEIERYQLLFIYSFN